MANKPTYDELEQRVKDFEEGVIVHKRTEEALGDSSIVSDTHEPEIDLIRNKLLSGILYTLSILGLPAIVAGGIETFSQGRLHILLIYVVVYLLVLICTLFSKKLSFQLRTTATLGAIYILGNVTLFKVGLSGAGIHLLITFCVLTTVLLGIRLGLTAVIVSIVSIAFVGTGMSTGLIPISPIIMMNSTSAASWCSAGTVFALIGVALVICPGMLQHRLQMSLQLVNQRTAELEESNRNLTLEIRERTRLEKKLFQAQKMEAMGLMAGGVAHDLNNILSGIVSYPELILMDLPEDSPLRKPIKTIQESGTRAADVVEDLLTIARGVATGKETLNLNTIVTEYLESAEHENLDKTYSFVNFETELDPDLLNMSGSPIHIKKTLMNLVINASEAIEGGGAVTISSINRYLDEPLKGYDSIRTGEYSVLSVSDDGSGITPQDLEKIFEPFYTKKEMGRSGTGLGLAVVWNTVQDHDGYINVRSSEKGTVFELYFPVTRKEAAALKEQIPLEDYLGHGEIILVVDDEERQREIACGMLTKLGYTVEAVSSGEEAIEYVKKKPVDLIVLDMVMPKGINGRETYEEIIKVHPGQKAIIASGFSETEDVKTVQKSGASQYIKKPYILEKIGVAIKEELEE